jgi:hypothetical protein
MMWLYVWLLTLTLISVSPGLSYRALHLVIGKHLVLQTLEDFQIITKDWLERMLHRYRFLWEDLLRVKDPVNLYMYNKLQ